MPFVTSLAARQRNKRWRDKNKDKVREQNAKYNYSLERRMLIRIKCRAKQNNIPFNISEEDIIIPEVCPILGIKLIPKRGLKRGYYPDSPSLDRIIPELGYIKGNVRVLSARANLLKNNASLDELRLVYEDALRIRP